MEVGWAIWRRPKLFSSLRELVQFAATKAEDGRYPDYAIVMVGYDLHPSGFRLNSIEAWEPNCIEQIEPTSSEWTSLRLLQEEVEDLERDARAELDDLRHRLERLADR